LNQLSYNGRIPKCEFPLGTSKEALLQKWGEPDYKSDVGMIEYWEYKDHHIIIGVHKNRMIDIRSFDPVLQKITLEQVEEANKPDEEYDHMSLNQHFVVYNMGKYKLRMIFPKPTPEISSPNLINISLVDINYSS
jgi:beta-N-acetylhexosaminidase